MVNPVAHPDLVIIELFKDRVSFYKAKKTNSLNDIESENVVLITEPDLTQTQTLLNKIQKNRFNFNRFVTSSNLEVIKSLVVSGAGIGILPGRVVGIDSKKVEIVDPKLPVFEDRICLVYRADMQKSSACRTFIEAVKSELKGR